MAAQREVSKQQGGWLPSSPVSLNAGAGWGAAAPSAEANEADAGTEPAHEQEPGTHYLTTSGLFERPPRPSAWSEGIPGPSPEPMPERSALVNEFRSTLLRPQSKEGIQPRKSWKGILALAAAGILLAAAAAAIYLYHSRMSVAEFQRANTWLAKQWTSDLQKISNGFHSQAAGEANRKSNRRRDLSALLRERKSVNRGIPSAPASPPEAQPNEESTSFDLYVSDSYGRRWIFTPTGLELGPLDHLGNPSASKPGVRPTAPEACRSPFYRPECP